MTTQPRGFKITFFLPDGTPDGMKIVEKSNWIGRAIVCPRSNFGELKQREDFKKAGVYVLVGQDAADNIPTAYIGEGDPVGERLTEHQRTKDFWSSLVFFTSKDENLNKAHVQYLESRLCALAREAKRCDLQNANVPALPSLSEADAAEMEEFLDQMLLIYPAIGIKVFQKPTGIAEPEAILYAKARGVMARGYEAADGFVVIAGSQVHKENTPSCETWVVALRAHLLQTGLLSDDGSCYRLTQNYTFNSPSLAAAVVLGRSSNGRTEWKDSSGRTLKEIQTGAAAAVGAGA